MLRPAINSVSVPERGFVALIPDVDMMRKAADRCNVSVPERGFVALILAAAIRRSARRTRVSVPERGFVALIRRLPADSRRS